MLTLLFLLATQTIHYEAPPPVYFEAVVTAYSSEENQTDDSPFITASNQRVREGIVANNCLPFGSFVEIEGVTYEVQDRMNRRYGCTHFDIWFKSTKNAIEWGNKKAQVTILAKKSERS